MLCNDCDKRDLCQVLCPEAELYVDQDFVQQSELTLTHENVRRWPERALNLLTKKQGYVVELLGRGYSRAEVANILGISRKALKQRLYRARKSVTEFTVGD